MKNVVILIEAIVITVALHYALATWPSAGNAIIVWLANGRAIVLNARIEGGRICVGAGAMVQNNLLADSVVTPGCDPVGRIELKPRTHQSDRGI